MTQTGTDLTRDVAALAALAAGVDEGQDGLLRRGLDWLARLVRFDLAAVFELTQGTLELRMARGPLADSRVAALALRLEDFPTIRAALETRRARAFTEADHAHGDGDPFDGVLDLPPGHACMVVPLAAGERVFGVLTLDRRECETYPAPLVELVEVYGQVLALALLGVEQRELLERLHRQDHAHAKLLEAQLGGDPLAVFEPSHSPAVRTLVARARQVAQTDTGLLLVGEPDTGRERLARAIHHWSARADQPFVVLRAGASSADGLAAILFGESAPGRGKTPGRYPMANGGTLYVEGIEQLPAGLQRALLAAQRDRVFSPVGHGPPIRADVRLVAATSVDLARAVAQGRFDEALYQRLSIFPLTLPALRERLEDLPQLCRLLLAEQAARLGRPGLRLSAAGLGKLREHAWPGNLRELGNVLERAALLSRTDVLGPASLVLLDAAPAAPVPRTEGEPPPGRFETLEEVERRHIARALAESGGRIYGEGGAAGLLGLKPSTLQSRMKKLGLTRLGRG